MGLNRAGETMKRTALLSALGFVAVTALTGGLLMALGSWFGPERLGLPREMAVPDSMLAGSPFASYLVPGLLLAAVVGGVHLAAFILVLRRHRWAGIASATAGYAILTWIFVQMVFIPFSVLQAVYFAAGLAELGFLLLSLGLFAPLQAENTVDRRFAAKAAAKRLNGLHAP